MGVISREKFFSSKAFWGNASGVGAGTKAIYNGRNLHESLQNLIIFMAHTMLAFSFRSLKYSKHWGKRLFGVNHYRWLADDAAKINSTRSLFQGSISLYFLRWNKLLTHSNCRWITKISQKQNILWFFDHLIITLHLRNWQIRKFNRKGKLFLFLSRLLLSAKICHIESKAVLPVWNPNA